MGYPQDRHSKSIRVSNSINCIGNFSSWEKTVFLNKFSPRSVVPNKLFSKHTGKMNVVLMDIPASWDDVALGQPYQGIHLL